MSNLIDTTTYEPCDDCGSPLDDAQRYCVVCGAHRRNANDPVSRYFAKVKRPPVPAALPPARRGDGRLTAAAFALIPVAAAIGVLVGHGGSDGTDKLAAALRAQKPPVVQVGGSGATSTASAGGAAVTSDLTLSKGFVVKLRTLPGDSDAAAVARAKRAARADGAKDIGVVVPGDFKLAPSAGSALVLYSGEFRTRAQAAKALRKLKKAFPHATVVAVTKASSSAKSGDVTATKPTAAQKKQGSAIVKEIQSRKGKKYVEQQRQLPDTIVIP